MKLTDPETLQALFTGKRIKRQSVDLPLLYFSDGGLISKETCDGKPRRKCVAAFYLEELEAEDWEVVE